MVIKSLKCDDTVPVLKHFYVDGSINIPTYCHLMHDKAVLLCTEVFIITKPFKRSTFSNSKLFLHSYLLKSSGCYAK